MATRLLGTLRTNRERVIPLLVAALLLSGLFFSLFGAKPAQADYYTGCGYGYGATQSGFGYGTGITYGYGYGNGGTFAYGYGNQVCPITITTTSLPNGMQDIPYSTSLSATGGTQTFTWTSSVLPTGLTLSSAGTLSGTPTVAGTFAITFTATDGNGQPATTNLTLTLTPFTSSGGGGAGGGTTTTTSTTSTTTTTVAPTTTTTTGPKPKYCNLFAKRFLGFAVVGRGMSRAIIGGCFYAQPTVTSNEPGTKVGVLHDNGRVLVVRVTVPGGSKPGWHTLTIREPNGKICRVNYLVRVLGR